MTNDFGFVQGFFDGSLRTGTVHGNMRITATASGRAITLGRSIIASVEEDTGLMLIHRGHNGVSEFGAVSKISSLAPNLVNFEEDAPKVAQYNPEDFGVDYEDEDFDSGVEDGDIVKQDAGFLGAGSEFTQDGKRIITYDTVFGEYVVLSYGSRRFKDEWDALEYHMERDGFSPNVWYVNDHGNLILMSRDDAKYATSKSAQSDEDSYLIPLDELSSMDDVFNYVRNKIDEGVMDENDLANVQFAYEMGKGGSNILTGLIDKEILGDLLIGAGYRIAKSAQYDSPTKPKEGDYIYAYTEYGGDEVAEGVVQAFDGNTITVTVKGDPSGFNALQDAGFVSGFSRIDADSTSVDLVEKNCFYEVVDHGKSAQIFDSYDVLHPPLIPLDDFRDEYGDFAIQDVYSYVDAYMTADDYDKVEEAYEFATEGGGEFDEESFVRALETAGFRVAKVAQTDVIDYSDVYETVKALGLNAEFKYGPDGYVRIGTSDGGVSIALDSSGITVSNTDGVIEHISEAGDWGDLFANLYRKYSPQAAVDFGVGDASGLAFASKQAQSVVNWMNDHDRAHEDKTRCPFCGSKRGFTFEPIPMEATEDDWIAFDEAMRKGMDTLVTCNNCSESWFDWREGYNKTASKRAQSIYDENGISVDDSTGFAFKKCVWCDGNGFVDGDVNIPCNVCGGTGEVGVELLGENKTAQVGGNWVDGGEMGWLLSDGDLNANIVSPDGDGFEFKVMDSKWDVLYHSTESDATLYATLAEAQEAAEEVMYRINNNGYSKPVDASNKTAQSDDFHWM